MPINFGESTVESFAALKPQKNVFVTKPTKVQDSYRLYFPKDFMDVYNIQAGDTVYLAYSENEDFLYLDPPPEDSALFIKALRVQNASGTTKYVIIPKKMIARYSFNVNKITIAQLDTPHVFKLLFYQDP